MKTTRKLTALLAVLGLALTLWAPVAVSAEAPKMVAEPSQPAARELHKFYFGRSILAGMPNGKALCYAYDRLAEGIAQQLEVIDIAHRTYEISYDEAQLVIGLLRADRPDFYYAYSVSYMGYDGVTTEFHPYYPAEWLAYTLATEQRAQELTAGLEGKSDYEKSLILHDRLCEAVVYDLDSDYNQTVISSLVYGESVCAGYARGYQMLMQKVGIPCFYVSGIADNGTGWGGHAWNLVQLDGEWYYTDVTWDDQNDDGGSLYYTHLNVTYDQISKDHIAEEFAQYLPKTTATAANYYVRNGLILDPDRPVDVTALAEAFKNNYPPQVYYTGEDYQDGAMLIFENLNDIVHQMTGGFYPYSVSVGILGQGLVVYLEIDHPHTFTTEKVAATCADKGSVTQQCAQCGYTTKEISPALGHSFGKLTHDNTHHGRPCTRCGLTIEHGKHTYELDGTACDTCGYAQGICNHVFETQIITPTCTESGQKTHTCVYCGEVEIETIPATGHQVTEIPAEAPTCMKGGWTASSYCSACGVDIVPREYLPPLEHDFSGMWNDDTHHANQCSHCGAVDAVTPHTYKQDGKTCDTCGYVDKVCHHEFVHPCGRFCLFCGEERLIDVAHTYDDDKDPDCNYCGEERMLPTIRYGDINDDGKINNRDLGLLQQYLSSFPVTVNLAACDVTNDGRVNNRDLGLFQQYLSGFPVELG